MADLKFESLPYDNTTEQHKLNRPSRRSRGRAIIAVVCLVITSVYLLQRCTSRNFGPGGTEPRLLGVVHGKRKLTFNMKGRFKILSFSDMHFGERWMNGTWTAWGEEQDRKTQVVHGTILDNERPDHVVFNGDIITGENVFEHNATAYLDMCFKPTADRGITFSCVHGNHDNSDNINHQLEIEYEQKHYSQLSYTRMDVGPRPWGAGNYWVPVYEKEEDPRPALILWFFDSRSFVEGGQKPPPQEERASWIDDKSVPRYVKQQATLMRRTWGHVPPSLVWVHIPFQKVQDMIDLPTEGIHDDEPGLDTQGYKDGRYTGADTETFDELVALSLGRQNVMAITSAHDHGVNWCARSKVSKGLTLCFNGHSGYGGYDTPNSKVRNARVFDLDIAKIKGSHPELETWNAYENGTTGEFIKLNQDFMRDYN